MKFVLTLLVLPYFAFSQLDSLVFPYASIGINGFKGDISGNNRELTPSFDFGIRWFSNKRMHGITEFSIGNFKTNAPLDANLLANESGNLPERFVKTNFVSGKLELAIDFIKKPNWGISFTQGIGLLIFNPLDKNNEPLIDQSESRDETEEVSNLAAQLPSSLNVYYILPSHWIAGFKIGYLNPTTDYLDNVNLLSGKSIGDNALRMQFQLFVPVNKSLIKK